MFKTITKVEVKFKKILRAHEIQGMFTAIQFRIVRGDYNMCQIYTT